MSHQVQKSKESIDSNAKKGTRAIWQYLAASELATLEPNTVLQRSLTMKSIVVTASSFATRSRRYAADTQGYEEIGAGLQGVIYEQLGSIQATKKERLTNKGRRLVDEYQMHQQVSDAFIKYKDVSGNVHIPQPYDFVAKASLSGQIKILSRMPENDREPGDIVKMERILPLPKVIRKAIIQKFYPDACDERQIMQILNERTNKHCLARVYLGKKKIAISKEHFTLRNYPLTLDIMEELDLDTACFAAMIGNAYAIMHWAAHITGDDVEFVLGTSASTNGGAFQYRVVNMFLLDFGQCDKVDMTEDQEDVFQAFKGSMVLEQNQIYLPHPRRSPALYQSWKSAYLNTSRRIIQQECLPFSPEEFLVEYEEYLEDFDPYDIAVPHHGY